MKILTKEEEQAHYNATLKGGITGGVVGLVLVCCPTPFYLSPLTTPREEQLYTVPTHVLPASETSPFP